MEDKKNALENENLDKVSGGFVPIPYQGHTCPLFERGAPTGTPCNSSGDFSDCSDCKRRKV